MINNTSWENEPSAWTPPVDNSKNPGDVLLSVQELRVHFDVYEGIARAVDGVTFQLTRGEILGIVGESGCGKSVTSMSILRLLPEPPAKISGSIKFEGRELLDMPLDEIRKIRGHDIAMIFQEPQSALNPVFTIGAQLAEVIKTHEKNVTQEEVKERVIDALRKVRIPEPESRLYSYPHELSGGMKQRVIIAMAMLLNPTLLIADEPTTALDVTIQRQILDLIIDLQKTHGVTVIFITHDLGVIAQLCQRVMVMYAGLIIEKATVDVLFNNPAHPYTQGLMKARPKVHEKADRLTVIPGRVPPATAFPDGCRFAPRCSYATEECKTDTPFLEPFLDKADHFVACIHAEEIKHKLQSAHAND